MKKYSINYNNGFTIDVTGTLEEAKEVALDQACYTQQPIYIHDAIEGESIAMSYWYEANGNEINEDEAILIIGNSGYYAQWI